MVKFADLGKDAKDLLNKNFHFGVVKLEGKTKSSDGVDFTAEGTHCAESGNICGQLESKFTSKDLTFTEKWTTDNVINTNVSIEDKLLKGLKMDFDCSFAPDTGKKSGKLKTEYNCPEGWFHSTQDIDLDLAGPKLHASVVTGYKGWLLGAQGSYDTANTKLTASNYSLAFHGDDFKIHSGCVDNSKFFGSIYHKVSGDLAAGAALTWSNDGAAAPTLTVGAQSNVNADTFYKAKIDNNLNLALSYVTKLRDGVQVTLSSKVACRSLNGGGHQVGMSLNLSA